MVKQSEIHVQWKQISKNKTFLLLTLLYNITIGKGTIQLLSKLIFYFKTGGNNVPLQSMYRN